MCAGIMAVYLFTWHAYRSWMPDNPRGYVQRGRGVQPPDQREAERYRERAVETEPTFNDEIQSTLIATLLDCREPLALRTHAIATAPTHVHALVSWTSDRTWQSIARSVRRSLTTALVSSHGNRTWFSRGRHAERVEEDTHFEHLMTTYLPDHPGRVWIERET